MDRLWPADGPPQPAIEDDRELEDFYSYPDDLRKPWVRMNFVTSLDGAATERGSSRGLSTAPDLRVLKLIRDLSDVLLVGLGTARIENYRSLKVTESRRRRRQRWGLSAVPPIALVTRTCALPTESPLLSDPVAHPIVLTCAAAPQQRRYELAEAGADVVVAGDDRVDLHAALSALDERGMRRIGCEGGPTLFGSLLREDLVDELCLTLSPLLTSGDAGRIAHGPSIDPRHMRLTSALHADGALLLRYERRT